MLSRRSDGHHGSFWSPRPRGDDNWHARASVFSCSVPMRFFLCRASHTLVFFSLPNFFSEFRAVLPFRLVNPLCTRVPQTCTTTHGHLRPCPSTNKPQSHTQFPSTLSGRTLCWPPFCRSCHHHFRAPLLSRRYPPLHTYTQTFTSTTGLPRPLTLSYLTLLLAVP